jgi:hypothetical protein
MRTDAFYFGARAGKKGVNERNQADQYGAAEYPVSGEAAEHSVARPIPAICHPAFNSA